MTDPGPVSPVVPRRIWFGSDADVRLAQFGLNKDQLRAAVLEGDEGRRRYSTRLHPLQSAGQAMWADTVAGLRRQLIRFEGWKIGRTKNYDTCYNLEHNIAIAVIGGNKYTGVDGRKDPKVKRKRGPITKLRVNKNLQGRLFDYLPGEQVPKSDDECETWFLLIFADKDAIYLELSLPIMHDKKGVVSEWGERILIDRLEIEGGVTPIAPSVGDSNNRMAGRK